jgi:MFS family permease
MSKSSTMFTPVLIAGCMIILISFLVRASFGVFQIPIAEDFGWLRVEFSLAIAIQNLAWGIGQPIFGALAEKIGDRRAIFAGGLFYAAGLVLSSFAVSPEAHQFYALLIGFGVAGTGFGVILAVVGRASRPEHRCMSLAIATAAGSGGQVIGPPLAEWLLGLMSWPSVFLLFAAAILGSLLILPLMRAPALADKDEIEQSMGEVLRHAMRDPSFAMIFFGFFSCGYQLGFISAHFPAMITEMCGPLAPSSPLNSLGITTTSALGAFALSLIGIANVAGTLLAGHLGNKIAKKISFIGYLFWPHGDCRRVYHAAYHAAERGCIFCHHGNALAGHRTADQRANRASVRVEVYGNAIRHCIFLASAGQFSRGVAWRQDV